MMPALVFFGAVAAVTLVFDLLSAPRYNRRNST
jgi:hypothetical protein